MHAGGCHNVPAIAPNIESREQGDFIGNRLAGVREQEMPTAATGVTHDRRR
jgi:hypothetical protein